MKLNVYVMFDTCAAVAERPFVARADGEVTRQFGDLAVSDQNPIGQHPEHWSLFKIGTYDDNSMFIEPLETGPKCIATALEMVALSQKIVPGSLKENGEINEISDGAQLQPGAEGEHTTE